MLAKINSVCGAFFALTLVLLLSGCTPAGPRAMLKGKKYLDRGDVADAISQFRRATTLLATNANAWNYLGVALQHDGQLEEAANAYRNAIRFDHDLLEAHFNLGVLSLAQNKFDTAKAELTTYTLRRPNDPAGWLKLGFAQLGGGGDTMPAERSFSTVLSLKADEAEAYNGLGLASLQAGRSHDAARFFAAALQSHPDFAPALLNLATVNMEYLHDSKAALANYEAYLALTPPPANYNDVKAIVANLIQSEATHAPAPPPVPTVVKSSTPPPEPRPRASTTTSRPAPVNRTETEPAYASRAQQRTILPSIPPPVREATQVPTQTVRVQPEAEIVTTPRAYHPAPTAPAPATNTVAATATTQEQIEAPMPDDQSKSGFWHRWFGYNKPQNTPPPANPGETVTPIPGTAEDVASDKAQEKPATPQPVTNFKRYHYLSPSKPTGGDHQAADGAFTKARLAEQDENWTDAYQWYQSAADFDPSWFEAQYNAGVTAQRLGNYSVALPRYERALVIQPDSVDARYNFALTLKAAGYALDAAAELKKILAAHPDEVRAHLTLGNLYAQTIHDIPQARQHYLRVLALQPDNPHAVEIRYWISANSK